MGPDPAGPAPAGPAPAGPAPAGPAPVDEPVVTITAVDRFAPAGTPLEFTVHADPAPAADLPVALGASAEGCTLADADTLTATILAGRRQATLSVPTTGVAVRAGGCIITVTITPDERYRTAATGSSATMTLTPGDATPGGATPGGATPGDPLPPDAAPEAPEDPALPVVTIAAVAGSVTEGDPVSFTVTATPAPAADLPVRVTWSDPGSFLSGTPPETVTISTSGTATLSAGTTSDTTADADGTVTVTIVGGSGYRRGSPSSASVTVADSGVTQPLPVVTVVTGAAPVIEGSSLTFTLTATPPPSAALTVAVALTESGSFLTRDLPTTVTIPTSGTATLSASTDDDEVDEWDGSVTVAIEDGDGYTVGTPGSATAHVDDNDVYPHPVVTLTAERSSVIEGSTIRLTLTTSVPPGVDGVVLSLRYTLSGEYFPSGYFTPPSKPESYLVIPWSTSYELPITTVDDSVDEPDGSLVATASASALYTVGNPSSVTVAVIDND